MLIFPLQVKGWQYVCMYAAGNDDQHEDDIDIDDDDVADLIYHFKSKVPGCEWAAFRLGLAGALVFIIHNHCHPS